MMTEETKQKISEAMTGNKNGVGYIPTKKHRKNMSRSIKKWHKETVINK